MASHQRGFSLIELLIVVTIILIIAAVAIPDLLKARMAANEAAAVGTTKSLITHCFNYHATHTDIGYPASLALLGPAGENIIDAGLAGGMRGGYRFDYQVTVTVPCPACTGGVRNEDFRICVDPTSGNRSGSRAFFATSDGVIHFLIPVPDGPVGPCAANATHPAIS